MLIIIYNLSWWGTPNTNQRWPQRSWFQAGKFLFNKKSGFGSERSTEFFQSKKFWNFECLTVTLPTGSTEPTTTKWTFVGTEWLQIWKMFQGTPPEIWCCTFWWYPLTPEVKFLKRSLPEVITGNCNLNSFSSDFWYVQSPSVQTLPNHVSLSQNQNPWFYRTSWNCGGWTFWKRDC